MQERTTGNNHETGGGLLLTTPQAAHYLGLKPNYMEKLRLTGGGPAFIKISAGASGMVRYSREDLDAWVSASRRRSTSDSGRSA
jgi:hypothetical protein